MRVKICGITSPEHLLVSAAAGADYIGLVCAPSRRQVTSTQAQRLVATLRDAGYLTPIVGLFVNESPDVVAQTVRDVGIDIIQLHGTEPFEQLDALPVMPVWRAVRLQGAPAEEPWLARSLPHVTLLVDAFVADAYGGTGVRADWEAAAHLAGLPMCARPSVRSSHGASMSVAASNGRATKTTASLLPSLILPSRSGSP